MQIIKKNVCLFIFTMFIAVSQEQNDTDWIENVLEYPPEIVENKTTQVATDSDSKKLIEYSHHKNSRLTTNHLILKTPYNPLYTCKHDFLSLEAEVRCPYPDCAIILKAYLGIQAKNLKKALHYNLLRKYFVHLVTIHENHQLPEEYICAQPKPKSRPIRCPYKGCKYFFSNEHLFSHIKIEVHP